MTEEKSSFNEGSESPYLILGLEPGATFEEAQKARDAKIAEIGDDLILKAKIEASFDALLMESLKARQLGKVSNEAANASKREKFKNQIGEGSLLTRISSLNFPSKNNKDETIFPQINIPEGKDLITRISLGILGIILVLISPDESSQLILSLSTIFLLILYVKNGRGIFKSLGWSVVFLSLGIIFGGIFVTGMSSVSGQMHVFTPNKIQAIISILFIWAGSFF